jgi:signal transduction histidine kinase
VRFADFPYLADWFAVAFRWLAALGLAVSLAVARAFTWQAALALFLIVGWNLFISFLAALNIRLVAHRPLNVLVDGLLAALLFALTGGVSGPLVWSAALVLLSAAVYFEWRGALLAALAVTLAQAGITYLQLGAGFSAALLPLILLAALNLALALAFGVPSRLLIRAVRGIYHQRLARARAGETQAQAGEHERMQAFYRLIESLSATLDYQTVLETALDLSAQGLGLSTAESGRLVCAVLLFGDTHLTVGAARHLSPTDLKRTFPAETGVLADVLATAEARQLPHPAEDPELGQVVALQGTTCALVLPLMRGLNAYGVMLYAHPAADFFTPERQEMLVMLSHQAVIAIQNARLFQELSEENRRIEESQEEARKNLARDLHDGPVQAISSIAMRSAAARRQLETDPSAASPELEWIESVARRTTEEIRHMLFTLRPLVLESQGLQTAFEALAEKMGSLYNQTVRVDVDPAIAERIDPARQSTIFALADEAVNNARKHAQAAQITLRLRAFVPDGSIALLEIADNGRGFDVEAVKKGYAQRGSLGLLNLHERVNLINGYLNLHSAPGKGTRVQVFIPLTPQAADRLQRGVVSAGDS